MKLVKQIQLFFQEGTSDKVYEIDLCESGDGYVVNFRYGRRGSALKEGTKTIFPVMLSEAEKVFSGLEQEKRKKGYGAQGEPPMYVKPEIKVKPATDKRKKAILKLLKNAAEGEDPENWPLSRIIWRAGDLKLTDAIPHIIECADTTDPFNIYSVVRTIGRCGTIKHLHFLKELQKKTLTEPTHSILKEVIIELSEETEKQLLLQAITETLPAPFKKNITNKNYKELEIQLREFLFDLKTASNDYLLSLYTLYRQDPSSQTYFKRIIQEIPLEVNYFKPVRQIFKIAEMLGDHATYALIARNIEKQQSKYRYGWMSADKTNYRAFSEKTKQYFTQRIVRTLNNLGEAGEASYTAMASELLLAYDDNIDFTPAHTSNSTTYDYNADTRRYTTINHTIHFDCYSKLRALNFILYKNSPRYEPGKNEWRCIEPYRPGNPAPIVREEAFPKLWNEAPNEIIKILSYSKCLISCSFALKVFKENLDFEQNIETRNIICFIQSPFEIIQNLGLEQARRIFDKQSPDKVLLTAMIDCSFTEIRKQAELWIQELKVVLFKDTDFVTGLLFMRTSEAHNWLRGKLVITTFTVQESDIISAKVIAFLVSMDIQSENDESYAIRIGDSLLIGFAASLEKLPLTIIQDLFQHPSAIMHAIAGKILMKHEIRPENLPEDFLKLLLHSENIYSRNIGIELLGKFPENLLFNKKEILISFCLSSKADVRNAVKPIISKLVAAYPLLGETLVSLFLPAFLLKETYEGVHKDLFQLLTVELDKYLHIVDNDHIFRLLNSKFRIAQLLGAVLLRKNIDENIFTIDELLKLINHPLQELRLYAQNIFLKYPQKARDHKEDVIRMTDSDWDETRTFAFNYFRNIFTPAEWNASLLISLCDSTKEDVQNFGREMITKYFSQDDGTEYLLKLSQHPNAKLQLYTSAYLEKYAGGNAMIIEKLKLYFITLLSQVNQGQVAKARAMDFLRREAIKNEHIAKIAAEIFSRISVSVAIREKAACIDALRDIQLKFPGLDSPIVMKEYNDYRKV